MSRTIASRELVDLADVAVASGDFGLAIQRLRDAVAEDPSSYNYVRLGAAYRKDRDLRSAADAYTMAMTRAAGEGRSNPAAHTGLAFVYIDANAPEQAIAQCLASALPHISDSVGFRIVASGYDALARRSGSRAHHERARELRAQADALFSPSVDMDRSTLRIERILRGHVAEVRQALAEQARGDAPETRPPVRAGSATRAGDFRFVAPN
jgi:tetratricopeptide (TPR) repeat protein